MMLLKTELLTAVYNFYFMSPVFISVDFKALFYLGSFSCVSS